MLVLEKRLKEEKKSKIHVLIPIVIIPFFSSFKYWTLVMLYVQVYILLFSCNSIQ